MNRRGFVQWMGLGWLVATVQGCFGRSDGGQATVPGDGGQAAAPAPAVGEPTAGAASDTVVGTVADLEQAGVIESTTASGPVLVTGNPANPNSLAAVNPTCTHQGCTVRWQAQQQELLCPCHGARFAPDGTVIQGPASNDLASYPVRVEGSEVIVDG